jgi:hypothetical protein
VSALRARFSVDPCSSARSRTEQDARGTPERLALRRARNRVRPSVDKLNEGAGRPKTLEGTEVHAPGALSAVP